MISNTFQTNTFVEGLDMDTDVSMLSDKRYRDAQNIRILTDIDGNSGVLHNTIQPTRVLDDSSDKYGTIIGVTTVNNYIIVVTVDETGRNIFIRYRADEDGVDSASVILKGYLGLCQDLTETPNLSIIGNYESESNAKIYFTDGKSPIKIFNIFDDRYSTANNGYTDENGDVINVEAFDITPGAILPPFKFLGLGNGSLLAGVVQYCYQLFNVNTSETTVSAMTSAIHLAESTTNEESQDYEGSDYNTTSRKSVLLRADLLTHNFEKYRVIRIQYTQNNQPPQIVVVNEATIDNNLDYIQFTDTGSSYLAELTVDEFNALTGYQFNAVTLAKMQNRLFAANVEDTTWDAGKYDARAYRADKDGQVLLQSSIGNDITFNIDTYDLSTIPEDHDCINPSNYQQILSPDQVSYEYGNTKNNDGLRILGGHGINIDYYFVYCNLRMADTLDERGDLGEQYNLITNRCSLNTSPVYAINGMTMYKLNSEDTEEDDGAIMLGDEVGASRIWNYADPDIDANLKGYQRDEVYRFGIIFYNSKSLPSSVYWIGDIKMPHANRLAPFTYNKNFLFGRPIGIKFTVKNIPEGAVAYDIVRCDRTEEDRSIVMQATGQQLYEYRIQENAEFIGNGTVLGSSIEMRPTPVFCNQDKDIYFRGASEADDRTNRVPASLIKKDYYRLVSPEICLQQENIESLFSKSLYLERIGGMISPTDPWRPGDPEESKATNTSVAITSTCYRALQPDGELQLIRSTAYVDEENIDGTGLPMFVSYTRQYDRAIYPGGQVTVYEGRYKAEISRYFVTEYYRYYNDNNTVELPFIETAIYPPIIPYENVQNCAAYTVNIAENTYANYAMTEFGASEIQTFFGPAGPCVIIKADRVVDRIVGFMSVSGHNDFYNFNAAPIINVKRTLTNPYGGNTYASRQNSVYISTNSYTLVGDSNEHSNYTFGGDIYLGVLDYSNMMIFQGNTVEDRERFKQYIGSYIPFETSINLNLMNGDMPHRSWDEGNGYLDSHLYIEPQQSQTFHAQSRPFYAYNAVYSSQPGAKIYLPKSIYDTDDDHIGNRIMVSQAKTNGEVLDSWTQFKAADYLDVDTQYGDITNLYTFRDRLFYFQKDALGIASINERSLVTDDNSNQIVLGTGGILSRYDYVTTVNGTSIVNSRSITNSDNVLYWYDYLKNEICAYDGGVHSLGKEKNIQSYLISRRESTLKDYPRNALFDKEYNEVQFNFENKSLVFNELLGRFTSLYTFSPQWSTKYDYGVIGIKDFVFYKLNSSNVTEREKDDSYIEIVINKDYLYTKTFDNIAITGNLSDRFNQSVNNGVIIKIEFNTKHQEAVSTLPTFDYREDTYRLSIPRESINKDPLSFPARLRGKYLISKYTFDNTDSLYDIPSITTTYRHSLV